MKSDKIIRLPMAAYRGCRYQATYESSGYLDVQIDGPSWKFIETTTPPFVKTFEMTLFEKWRERPIAFGMFRDDQMLGFVEGSFETWHQLFRVTDLLIFSEFRHQGIGRMLLQHIEQYAVKKNSARAMIIETQTCNLPAINFYKSCGYRLVGANTIDYQNDDIARHEVRLELGKTIDG